MKNKTRKFGAVVFFAVLFGTLFYVPASSMKENSPYIPYQLRQDGESYNDVFCDLWPLIPDRKYILFNEPAPMTKSDENPDAGTKRDAGKDFVRATPIYPGELIDNTPGRGRTGELSSSDQQDWYFFSICEGQTVVVTLTPQTGFDFDLYLIDENEVQIASSTNAGSTPESITTIVTYTGYLYIQLLYISGSGTGEYAFSVTLTTQDDANSGNDASNTFASALLITPGDYNGYLDMSDPYDFYKFQVETGKGIHLSLEMQDTAYLTDFDLALYSPTGDLVYEENQYYDDELLYPATETGEWRVRIDIFPGWTDIPNPTEWEYYAYGSGAYSLSLSIQTSAPTPTKIPQPQISPIAKTFKVTNDATSTKDEFGYLAAIPASNYLKGETRFVAPIIYTGDDTPTNYYETDEDRGTVDDTAQYLIDDWNTYLAMHGKTSTPYDIPVDPVAAAAEIAQQNWGSSDLAVVAVDGSGYNDEVKTLLKRTKTLTRNVDIDEVENDDPKLQGEFGYMQFIGPKWCAISVNTTGIETTSGSATGALLTQVFPKFIDVAADDWPSPYDGPGYAGDIYYPVTRIGFWSALSTLSNYSYDKITVTKYQGNRYHFNVKNEDSVLTAKLVTTEASDLLVFLVDPAGHIRAPDMPIWNGPVNPIHVWNGLENPTVNPWRCWNPEPHTEVTAEVMHPEKGWWTVIVVPRYGVGASKISYTVTVDQRIVNTKRADAEVSAANAAVIASLNHAPLLYVLEDTIPSSTSAALTALGVNKVIFVERGDIGSVSFPSGISLEADLTTMEQIVDHIKSYDSSENFITITSLKTGDGFFAPAAYLAAYHGSPVLRIEDAPGNPAAMADRIETWRLWEGDYYHGSRAPGHLPEAEEPVTQGFIPLLKALFNFLKTKDPEGLPPIGLDADRYWRAEMYNETYEWIASNGLDLEGQEAYCFVAPRTDIYLPLHSVMIGNKSYAGHIPGDTPAYSSAIIVRSVLYPALIFANPNRNTTTAQLMNYPDGETWTYNNGDSDTTYSSRTIKQTFSSHLRTFDGHCLWDAHIQRMNEGVSVFYYTGHGTGGSGISAQYYQTEHCNYPEQTWWDAWRGYSAFDVWRMPRSNGLSWYNPEPPSLYDIIQYDHVDDLTENLRSCAVFYQSCSTGDGYGPLVYLDHGAVLWYGNAGSGLRPEADLMDDMFFISTMMHGENVGQAYSKEVWLHYRDFTTLHPLSMYGPSTQEVTTVQCIYGDPTLVLFSPEWSNPTPVDP
ncbi:MAG: PPC domain-containing protein [Candidatus Thermoplasmatota archaeon]|nr:PPC domain-containing protein [Candidatus Thermoplasmatota archaeon]